MMMIGEEPRISMGQETGRGVQADMVGNERSIFAWQTSDWTQLASPAACLVGDFRSRGRRSAMRGILFSVCFMIQGQALFLSLSCMHAMHAWPLAEDEITSQCSMHLKYTSWEEASDNKGGAQDSEMEYSTPCIAAIAPRRATQRATTFGRSRKVHPTTPAGKLI